ncbi:AAA family ATPase [Streptomyces sp. NPDC058548]|uniref:helix-turn-helix transcriptional regulator n=1 Tax=unclassified Streptomyces TaxID=2593676 RepID=UPI003654B8F3
MSTRRRDWGGTESMGDDAMSARMVGRAGQVETLVEHVRAVARGHGGSILIEGEPGIGKTTLLARAAQEADRACCRVLQATATELGERFPLRAVLGGLGTQSNSDHAEMAELLQHVQDEPEGRDAVDGGTPRYVDRSTHQLMEQLVDGATRMSRSGAVVLLLDDLHWADEATLLVWQRLSRVAARMPLLLIATSRRGVRRRELDQLRRGLIDRGTTLLKLSPMPPEEVVEMAASILGAEPDQALRQQLVPAGGNPLYVRELVDVMHRDGGIVVTQGDARLAGDSAVTPPLPPLAAIARRFGFLSDDTLESVRTASLLGTEFTASELAAVTGRSPVALLRILDEAVSAGVVTDVGERMRFRHAVIQHALYDAMPPSDRREAHWRAAQALARSGAAMERVAQQLTKSEGATGSWMVQWIARTARLLSVRAPEVTVELLQRAIDQIAPDAPLRTMLEEELGAAAFLLRRPDCVAIIRRLWENAVEPERRASLTCSVVHGLFWEGHWNEILAILDAAEAEVGPDENWRDRFRAERAITLVSAGRYEETVVVGEQVVAAAMRKGDAALEAYGRHALAMALLRRRRTEPALTMNGLGLEAARRMPRDGLNPREDKSVLITLLIHRGLMLAMLDRPDEALKVLSEARAASLIEGMLSQLSGINATCAAARFWTGRWDEALADIEGMSDLPAIAWFPVLQNGLAAVIHGHREHDEEARRHLRVLNGMPDPQGLQRGHSTYRLMAVALMAERDGRLHEALAVLLPTLDAEYARDLDQRYQWMPDIVRLALATGDTAAADAAAAASAADAERAPSAGRDASVHRCRGFIAKDLVLLQRAADYYLGAGRPLAAGQTLEDLAVVLAVRGDLTEARAQLARAFEQYGILGARWDVKRATARLRAVGVRTGGGLRARPRSGWDSLTPAELKVARLVAEGRSNPEVAAELFLSPRTVQTHVSHILGKLGLKSRTEVARAVHKRPD